MTLDRLTQITSVGITSGITLNNATLTGVTTIASLDSVSVGGTITAVDGNFSGNVTAVGATFSGNVSIAGTLTYEDVTNIDSIGIITARDTIDAQGNVTVGAGLSVVGVSTLGNTVVGGATTELVVGGDARITGILTVGSSSITIDGTTNTVSTTNLTVNGNAYPSAGPLNNRNLVINGAMQVAQRGTSSSSLTSGNNFILDRWRTYIQDIGTYTISQASDAPTGFRYSYKVDCTTADASPSAADDMTFYCNFEGQDFQHLKKGTASAESVTLSFWVKSNKTTTGQVNFRDQDNSRMISGTYTINSADTWEYKSITFVGDTSGVLDNDNAASIQLQWYLDSGSNFTSGSINSSWGSDTAAKRNVNNFGLASSTDNYWQITGIQLEVGTVATPFEHRSYGDELARCQRYCYAAVADGSIDNYAPLANGRFFNSSDAQFNIFFPVTMRNPPTLDSATTAAGTFFYNTAGGFGGVEATTIALNERAYNSATVYAQGASGQTAGNGTTLYSHDAEVAKLIFIAEL